MEKQEELKFECFTCNISVKEKWPDFSYTGTLPVCQIIFVLAIIDIGYHSS